MPQGQIRNPMIAEQIFNVPLMVEPRKAAAVLYGLNGRIGEISSVHQAGQPVIARDHIADAGEWRNLPAITFHSNVPQQMGVISDQLHSNLQESGKWPFDVVEDVAVITVEGTLVHKGRWIGSLSGETSYEGLSAQIRLAADDARIRGIVLEVDSFGGGVQGCFDLVDTIFEARAAKPIHAILTENACSAGYAIASAADHITVPRTGLVGSIGVLCMHVDFSQMLAKNGMAVTFIQAGEHKTDGNSFEPLPDDVRADFQARVDGTWDLFLDTVGRNRGARLSSEEARATQAACIEGDDAVDIGLADAVAAPLDALESFLDQLSGRSASASTPIRAKPPTKGNSMSLADLRNQGRRKAEGQTDDDEKIIDGEEDDEAENTVPDGNAGGDDDDEMAEDDNGNGDDDDEEDDAEDEGEQTAQSAERARISAIVNAPEAKGRGKLAKHLAFETDMSAKDAIAALKASGREGSLADRMAGTKTPAIGSGGGDGSASEGDTAKRMIGAYAASGGGHRVRKD
jgi:signal peptide peptidase SppA